MNQPPLNPDEIRAAALANRHALLDEEFWGFSSESDAQDYGFEEGAKWAAQRLAAALPEVTSVPGVYDLGAPEPVGVDQVIECDEFGEPDERGDSANEPTWSKTTDGTRWKGYKDGKEYRTWADLVRRYGPLTEYRPEVKR